MSHAEDVLRLVFDAKALGEQIESGVVDVADVADAAEIAHALRDAVRAMRAAQSEAERLLVELMGDDRSLEVAGVGMVEKRRQIRYRRWQHDELVREVMRRAEARIDLDTGELLESEAEAAFRLLLTWAQPSWRAGALKADGVQVDEFCEVTPDGWSLSWSS